MNEVTLDRGVKRDLKNVHAGTIVGESGFPNLQNSEYNWKVKK